MANVRFYSLMALLVGALMFLQYHLWFQQGGIIDMMHLKQTLAAQMQENENLKKRNETLLFQVQRLQHSHDAVESRARNELGMIKKDETFYQIVK